MKENILKNSHKFENHLSINISNISTFGKLMEKVKTKQNELQEALNELNRFKLIISFTTEKDEE